MTLWSRRGFETHWADVVTNKSVAQLKAIGYYSVRCEDKCGCGGWHAVACPPNDQAEKEQFLKRYRGRAPQLFGGPYDGPGDR